MLGGAAIFIVTEHLIHGKCIAFYKEYRKYAPKGFWSIPGGRLNINEDPINAAIRETEEEAYIKFNKDELSSGIKGNKCIYFIGKRDNLSVSDFFTKRYKTRGLQENQKEMHSMTLVPLKNLENLKENVVDINGNVINIRNILYRDLVKDPSIIQKLNDTF